MTPDDATRSRLMAQDAVEYFAAAKKVLAGEDVPSVLAHLKMPLNFLLGQCCELILKSALSAEGWDDKRLKNTVGHDLVRLLTAAHDEGLSINQEFARYCKIMAEAHRDHHFRYSGRKPPMFVDPHQALKMIEPQLKAVAPFGLPWD